MSSRKKGKSKASKTNSKKIQVKEKLESKGKSPNRLQFWIPILISVIVAISVSVGIIIQHKQLKLQQRNQKRLEKEIINRDAQWKLEFEELKRNSLVSTYHSVLSDLSSSQPERRLAGLRSAKPLIKISEYQDSIRPAIIESLGRYIKDYSTDRSIEIERIEPFIKQASTALRASDDCKHLRETINGIYVKLKLSKNLPQQISLLAKEEQIRRYMLFNILMEEIGRFLFCSFLSKCANNIDFHNTVNGSRVLSSGLFTNTIKPSIPPDALYAISGLLHVVPKIDERNEAPLIKLLSKCDEASIELIKRRACAPIPAPGGGLIENKTPGCEVLKKVTFPGGGWVGVGVKVKKVPRSKVP